MRHFSWRAVGITIRGKTTARAPLTEAKAIILQSSHSTIALMSRLDGDATGPAWMLVSSPVYSRTISKSDSPGKPLISVDCYHVGVAVGCIGCAGWLRTNQRH
jgi:hypothetical protein